MQSVKFNFFGHVPEVANFSWMKHKSSLFLHLNLTLFQLGEQQIDFHHPLPMCLYSQPGLLRFCRRVTGIGLSLVFGFQAHAQYLTAQSQIRSLQFGVYLSRKKLHKYLPRLCIIDSLMFLKFMFLTPLCLFIIH